MRNEIACLGCGQATFRLVQFGCRFAAGFPGFAFDRDGDLLLARAMFLSQAVYRLAHTDVFAGRQVVGQHLPFGPPLHSSATLCCCAQA